MKKMNKKGFTLIEMLVVIAIIAVLVAIIIPTVSSATDKAGAATNAANLRAVYAELQTDKLSGVANSEGYVHMTDAGVISLVGAPTAAKTVGCDKGAAMTYTAADATAGTAESLTYNGHDVTYFATVAETGKAPTTNP